MNYKKASRLRLRFQTVRGLLSVEQLWGLSVNDLDALAVSLEQEYKKSGKKSFLEKKSEKDKEIKLRFDIVLDILNTKVEEMSKASEVAEVKAHNQKILSLISNKREEKLNDLSEEELMKLLK